MTRPTSVALGLTTAAAALSLTIVNSPGVASAAAIQPHTIAPATAGAAGVRPMPPAWAAFMRLNFNVRRSHRRSYTVRHGDSLWSISKKAHVNWYNLAADNHLKMYTVLEPGRVLRLPLKGEGTHAPMPLQSSALGASTVTTSASSSVSTQANTPTVTTGGIGSFEQCVISRESGGNPQVTNASGHWGLFQFSEATWVAYGGSPSAFGNADAAVQEQVFANAMARDGEDNWAPYDGC